MKIRFILLTLLCCSCKNYTFEGNVHDYDTNKPIKNAAISINKSITQTDSLGFFSLKINSSEADIIIKKERYATKKIHRKSNSKHKDKNVNKIIYLYNSESDFGK